MALQLTPRLSSKPIRFPNAIREYRVKAGLTQKALAALLGKTRKVVSSWECGRHFPSGPVIFKLAKTLGTLVESLYLSLYTAVRSEKHPSEDSKK